MTHSLQRTIRRLAWMSALAAAALAPRAEAVGSYAIAAQDAPGSSTGAADVALGVADYRFVNDAGAGFGGANADVFGPGESTVLAFAAPIRNVEGQPDLRISAFVGGAGASDDAAVEVEVSSDGVAFESVATFQTADGRDPLVFSQYETGFASVKHFAVELGAADRVTHVRLTNLGGTAEGLRLDAVEGIAPETRADHAFEIRFERYRGDEVGRFLVRIKNLARAGGVPIRELRIDVPVTPAIELEDTDSALCEESYLFRVDVSSCAYPTRFVCAENCIPDFFGGTPIAFSRHVWSSDGVNEAAPGEGLEPGRVATHVRSENFDTDPIPDEYLFLDGFAFVVTFADGETHAFDFNTDVLGQDVEGALFQKYQYFVPTPEVFGPRPVHHYEFVPEPAAAAAALAALGALAALVRRRAAHAA